MDEANSTPRILEVLEHAPRPLKAREIAKRLAGKCAQDVDRRRVNHRLYYALGLRVVRDDGSRWGVPGRDVAPLPPIRPDSQMELNAEQVDVIQRSAEERLLVTAPAGTGKTHVLPRRLEHLVEEEGLRGGDQVVVLSFSRAAVGEVRRRLEDVQGLARNVRIVTFDSFATWMLGIVLLDDSWAEIGYDGRIRACTRFCGG